MILGSEPASGTSLGVGLLPEVDSPLLCEDDGEDGLLEDLVNACKMGLGFRGSGLG